MSGSPSNRVHAQSARSAATRLGARPTRRFARTLTLAAGLGVVGLTGFAAEAAVLEFETQTPQSMWGSGAASILDKSIFIGAEWSTPPAELGNIIGDVVTTPSVPPIQITPAIPRKLITPAVPRKLLIPRKRVCLFGKCVTTPAVYSPAIPAVYSPAVPAVYTPAIPGITIDTRTGAKVEVTTTGKIGLQQTIKADAGSVQAQVSFDATVTGPAQVQALQLFALDTSAALRDQSTFSTNFPQVSAKTEFIIGAKAELDVEAYVLGLGGKTGTTTIGFDPVALELISFNEDNNGRIRLLGIDALGPAGFNFGDPISFKGPTGAEVGNFTLYVPNLATSGDVQNGSLGSSGEVDILELKLDLDGIAQTAAGLPPVLGAGLNFEIVDGLELGISYDLLDVEFGPIFEIIQNFDLDPTLMVDLAFSEAVFVEGFDDPVTTLTAAINELPRIALNLNQTVQVTPTYWIDAQFHNITQLGVDGEFTLDVLQAAFNIEALGVSFDLGQLGPLFEFAKRFDIADFPPLIDNQFMLGGFEPIVGESFTLTSEVAGSDPLAAPPELANALAVLVTGSPVELFQEVDKPTDPTFDFSFDYLFATDTGTLDVYLGSMLITTLESLGAMADFATFSTTLTTADFFALTDSADLRFRFDGPSGSTLLLDNVEFPGILNGNFDLGSLTGRLTNWDTWTQDDLGIVEVAIFADEESVVPEPTTAGLGCLAMLSLLTMTARRRRQMAA